MLKLLPSVAFLLLLTSCKNPPVDEDFVPVVGLGANGKSSVHYVPTKTFHREFSPFIGKMAEEVTHTLDQHENTSDMPWTLSRVTVGLALETEVELMEVAEGELHGQIELRFQKAN